VPNSPSLVAVVDDESVVCRAFQWLLESAGFEVVTFCDGAAFFEFLESRQPECLVLDLNMPFMSGFDLQSRLQQEGIRIPVVAITGQDTPEAQKRAMDGGAVAYLRKPVDDQTLIDVVVAAIATNRP
jgi:FixJ family two-component response regulator